MLTCLCAQDEADKLGVDISRCTVEDPETSQRLGAYVDLLCEARRHKVGMRLVWQRTDSAVALLLPSSRRCGLQY